MQYHFSGERKRQIIQALLAVDDRCHWCRQPMRYYPGLKGGALPPDAVTIDHRYSKLQPGRKTDETAVLACFKCNQERGQEEVAHAQDRAGAAAAARMTLAAGGAVRAIPRSAKAAKQQASRWVPQILTEGEGERKAFFQAHRDLFVDLRINDGLQRGLAAVGF
jgi:hypothetical protein